ncbi:MAG: serine protease [Anaerolineales bacterium]|nr:serine protease [Chloroflexota bacterium]MBL6979568.1 serine protease [Anaerolineales bacterium]
MQTKTYIPTRILLILSVLFLIIGFAAQISTPESNTIQFRHGGDDDDYFEYGVTGKTEATPGAQPWMVALVDDGLDAYDGTFCGGTLIAPQWVLTAAHCIEDMRAAEMDVIIGRHQLSSSQGERIDVTHLIMHPDYYEFHDIALIHLAAPATVGQPIPLVTNANEYLDDASTDARVTGWGLIPEKGEEFYPDNLYGVSIPIVTDEQCKATYGGDVDSTVICAGLESGGADSCDGDSGGPLVVPNGNSWALAGVVSWGDGCGLPGGYGVYTRVVSYESWINGYLTGSTALPEQDSYPIANSDDEWDDEEWEDEYYADESLIDTFETEEGFVDIYSLGEYDEKMAAFLEEIANEYASEVVSLGEIELLIEDWSDEEGAYFAGTMVVNNEVIEVSSDINLEAVVDAAREYLN